MDEYKEGQRAFWNGIAVEANPYTKDWLTDYLRKEMWHRGWVFAQWVSTQGGTIE